MNMCGDSLVWLLTSSLPVWELAVIGSLVRELRGRLPYFRFFALKNDQWLDFSTPELWSSLSWRDKALLFATKGRIWHVWGTPPPWWHLIGVHAKTIQSTSGLKASYRGLSQKSFFIPPAFESKISWALAEEGFKCSGAPALFIAGVPNEATGYWLSILLNQTMPIFKVPFPKQQEWPGKTLSHSSYILPLMGQRGGVLLLLSDHPSLALLAAQASILGVPVLSPPSAFLDRLLGSEGYVRVQKSSDGPLLFEEFLFSSFSSQGKNTAVKARNCLLNVWTPQESVDALLKIYSQLDGALK